MSLEIFIEHLVNRGRIAMYIPDEFEASIDAAGPATLDADTVEVERSLLQLREGNVSIV
jgi:hypothetical protein